MIIDLAKLVNSKKTYPNWSSEKIYSLQTDCVDNKTLVVYYLTNSNKIVHRVFPKQITVNPSFAYVLGLIKGEGANALGKSNYRRFTFTNSNWQLVKLILDELMKQKLISESDIIERSTYILHAKKSKDEVIKYWSEKTKLPKNKFSFVSTQKRTKEFGICHIYISDVLLRRVLDLIMNKISE